MNDIWWLARKTLRNTFRRKSSWFTYFGLPLIGVLASMLMYGNASDGDLRVGIVNLDGGQAITQDAIDYVGGLNNVKVAMTNETNLRDQIADGELDSGLVFGQGFADSLKAGAPAHLDAVSVKGAQVTAYVKAMLENYSANVAAIGRETSGDAKAFDAIYAAYRGKSFGFDTDSLEDKSNVQAMTYQSIGFLLLFMMFSAVSLTDIILLDKENRTFLRLLSSPVSARNYVLSNVAVSLTVLIVQISVTLFFMKAVFHIDAGVPFPQLLAVLVLFSVAAIALSLLLVAFSRTRSAAGALQNLVITPTCLLSGCFFPAEVMPETVRKIASFMPQHWLLDTITKLMEGRAFGSLGLNFAILAAFAAAFATVAIYRFSRNNDVRQFI